MTSTDAGSKLTKSSQLTQPNHPESITPSTSSFTSSAFLSKTQQQYTLEQILSAFTFEKNQQDETEGADVEVVEGQEDIRARAEVQERTQQLSVVKEDVERLWSVRIELFVSATRGIADACRDGEFCVF